MLRGSFLLQKSSVMGKKKIQPRHPPLSPPSFPVYLQPYQVIPHRICAWEQHRGRKGTGKKHSVNPPSLNGSETMGQHCHSLAINLLCNLCQVKHSASVSPLGNSKVLYFKLRGVHQAPYEKPPKLWPVEFHTKVCTHLLSATFPPSSGFFLSQQ